MIVHEVMMLKNNDLDDYEGNYSEKVELFHMHYHNDHHENLVNKIVVVEVQHHFQQTVHNVLMEPMLNHYYLVQILEKMKLLFEIQYQNPK
jgi:hypothetical protein